MTFYETEWRKLLRHGLHLEEPTFVGRSCYARLDGDVRLRLEFVTNRISAQYEGIKATIINRKDGPIDSVSLWFGDILGIKKGNNPNFTQGILPHIWEGGSGPEWYVYQPSGADYRILADAVNGYAAMFQEPRQSGLQIGPAMK